MILIFCVIFIQKDAGVTLTGNFVQSIGEQKILGKKVKFKHKIKSNITISYICKRVRE